MYIHTYKSNKVNALHYGSWGEYYYRYKICKDSWSVDIFDQIDILDQFKTLICEFIGNQIFEQ